MKVSAAHVYPSQGFQALTVWQKLQLFYQGILENGGKSLFSLYPINFSYLCQTLAKSLLDFAFLLPFLFLDKRTDNWLLVHSPVPIGCIFLCYLVIIWVGPKLMAKREPVNLKPVLIVYNFAMVCLSAYMFYEVLYAGTFVRDVLRWEAGCCSS